jgi:hypothetical protein
VKAFARGLKRLAAVTALLAPALLVALGVAAGPVGALPVEAHPNGAVPLGALTAGAGVQPSRLSAAEPTPELLQPPLCARYLSAGAVAKFFHLGHLGDPTWLTDGYPVQTCVYAYTADQSVSDLIEAHQDVSGYKAQVQAVSELEPKAEVLPLPSLGRYAVDVVTCVGGPGQCFPEVIVLDRGYLVEVSEALQGVPVKDVQATMEPELEAWAKAILAQS